MTCETIRPYLLSTAEDILGQDIFLDADLPFNVWPVALEREEMCEAFANVLRNIRRTMNEGGTVELIARNRALARDDEVDGLPAGQYVQLTLSYSGPGLSRENLLKVFDPWCALDLGPAAFCLTNVKGMVARHHGYIDVSSEPESGAEIHLYLPALPACRRPDDGTTRYAEAP